MDQALIRDLLLAHWDLVPELIEPLAGGMNSETWEVAASGERWVAKSVVPRDTRGLEAGLHAAAALEVGGISAGAARPTTTGSLTVRLPQQTVALLTRVEGRELDGDGADVALIGRTLARAHEILAAATIPDAPSFDWIDLDATHLDVEPWVRPSISPVLGDWAAVRSHVSTWCFIHGDPTPEAFLQDARGEVGMIDWAGGVFGPCLYDLASAAMYVGPEDAPELVDVYRRHGPAAEHEIEVGLPVLLRLRYAVQADYFARRLYEEDLTGIADHEGNRKGLDDARRFLGA